MAASAITDKPRRTWLQFFGRWLFVLAMGYLGALVLLIWLENRLVYYPVGADDWQAASSPLVEDMHLTSADGTRLHGWWLPRSGATGAVVYFHGNGGNLSWWGDSLTLLSDRLGESVLIVDYPGYGKSEGRPSEAGCFAAADAAYVWLTATRKIPGEQIIMCGESLGGGVAVDLASRRPHRALVLIKTFTSLPDVGQRIHPYFPVRWLMRNRFDSLSKIGACTRPTFITHGDADTLVPFDLGVRLYEAAPGPKQFLRIHGGDHNGPLPDEFFTQLRSFLETHAPLPVVAAN